MIWLTLFPMLSGAAPLPGLQDMVPPFDPVHIRAPNGGEQGNGARFRTRDGCVTITAQHVVSTTQHPIVTPGKSATSQATVEREDAALDIALIKQLHETPQECSEFPSDAAVDRMLKAANRREVWFVNPEGGGYALKVDLVSIGPDEIEVEMVPNSRAANAPQAFAPGMSGAVVVFDGLPVAILKSVPNVNQPVATAVRLNRVRQRFADSMPAPVAVAAPRIKLKPYDISGLPEDLRQAVRAARRTREQAEAAVAKAREVRVKAENASGIAKGLPPNYQQDGYANYAADNGNDYAGQVQKNGTLLSSHGYGVIITKSEPAGEEYYCWFIRNVGCSGPGVKVYPNRSSNTSNLVSREGEFVNGLIAGSGMWKWRHIDAAGPTDNPTQYMWDDYVQGKRVFGVSEQFNGRRYEGQVVDGSWDGLGVFWDAEGQLMNAGVWAKGKLVEDRTTEARTAMERKK